MSYGAKAPNLCTYSGTIDEPSEVIVLRHDIHRNYLAFGQFDVASQSDVRCWVGPLAPPADVALWLPVSEMDWPQFPDGVAGPVYIAEFGFNGVSLAVVSPLSDEVAGVGTRLPTTSIADICLSDDLVAGPDNLVTETGEQLVTCM